MKKVIHYDLSRAGNLVCDNPRCGYELPEPIAFSESAIGTICPRCDSNMLTRKDYEAHVKMFKWIDRINRFFSWFGIGTEEVFDRDKYHVVSIRHHNGKTFIEKEHHEPPYL